jgi:hypothetical protein
MKAVIAITTLGALALLIAPLRRSRRPRASQPARIDAAIYADLMAEAERIAAPFKRHVHGQLAVVAVPQSDDLGGNFPEVAALLERAGILA